MYNTTNTKLPPTVEVQQLRRKVDTLLRSGVLAVQNAVKDIWGIQDLPHVGSVEELTPAWVQGIIAEGINATKADKSLTASGRNARLNEWRTIEFRAKRLTETVQNFLASFPEVVWCLDPVQGTASVSEENIDKVIAQRSTLTVPDIANTHWAKLQSIIAAVKDLREWERQNDILPYRVGNAVNCSPSIFAEQWATGAFRIDHRYDKYRDKGINKGLII